MGQSATGPESPESIALLAYTDPSTLALNSVCGAQRLIESVCAHQRNWVELDFSGLMGLSREFSDALVQGVERELPEIWLVSRHYGPCCQDLVSRLVTRLTRLRTQAWINGCEMFSTGISFERSAGEKRGDTDSNP